MKRQDPKPFMARVRAHLPLLHPTERRLAEAVLEFPGDMAGYSASEIAELAGVSNATVSRFVRKLGYGSFDEARKAVRDDGRSGAALMRFATMRSEDNDPLNAHLVQSHRNLDETFAQIDLDTLYQLASTILGARRVWTVGFRAGFPLAQYLSWQIRQVRPDIALLPRQGETLAETAAAMQEGDLMLLVLLRRAPKIAVSLAETALAHDVDLAVIGDDGAMHTLQARWHLPCVTGSQGALLNHVGVMAVCNLIASRVLELSGSKGRAQMGVVEDIHDRLGEL